jgi:hypothetical protein
MKRDDFPSPLFMHDPYNSRPVNVEPLFFLLRSAGSARDIADYLDTVIRDLVVAYQLIPDADRVSLSGEISFLFDIRDAFQRMDVSD